MSTITSNIDNHSEIIPGLPRDLNRSVLSFIDNSTALVLSAVNRNWKNNTDIQERIEQATHGVQFERRIPENYRNAFQAANMPIHCLPLLNERPTGSAFPHPTNHAVVRGTSAENTPFIQISIKGRPDSNASYPISLYDETKTARVKDAAGHIIIYKRYIEADNTRYYVVGTELIQSLFLGRHFLEAGHEGIMGCDDCPFTSARINPQLLQRLLSDEDPDFCVKAENHN
jgi:hypothetical protein